MIHKNRNKQATQPRHYEDIWVSKNLGLFEAFVERIFCQEDLSRTPVIIIVAIFMLQTLSLLIETTLITFPNTTESLQVPISTACNIILGRQMVDFENITNYKIILIVMLVAYLVISMAFTFLNFSKFTTIQRRFARVFGFWKIFIQIHFYCLFLPISNILIELTIQAQKLSTASFSGILTIVLVAESINVILCLMYFLSSSSLRSNDHLTLLHHGFIKYYCMERIIMSLINLFVLHAKIIEMSSITINIINLVMMLPHSSILFYTLPFYHKAVMKFFLMETRINLAFPLVNIIVELAFGTDGKSTAKYIFFIVVLILPIYFKFALAWVELTISQTLMATLTHLSMDKPGKKLNTYWLIQSMYQLKQILESDFGSPVTERYYLKSMFDRQGYIKHLQEYLVSNGIEFESPLDIKSNVSILVIKVLSLLRRKYPHDNLLGIIMADLFISDFNMIPDSYAMLQELSKVNLPVNLRLSLMIIHTKIQRLLSYNEQEDISHLHLSTFFNSFVSWFKLKDNILKQIEESNVFYKNILDKAPDLLSIMKSGQKAQAYREDIEKFWKNIPEESMQSCCTVMLVYALYKIKVLFEYKEGVELFKKYTHFIRRKEAMQYSSEITSETALSAENGVFLIDTSNKEFGNIVYCSNSTTEMFGDKPANLIGKNIGVLMPPFLRSVHDILMSRKFESTESILKTTFAQSFGVDRQGFAFPVNVVVSIYPWINKGLYFAGIVRKVQNRLGYMLMDENGYIDSYSRSLQEKLNLPLPSQDQRVHILELCGPSDNKNQPSFRIYVNSVLSADHKSGLTSEFSSSSVFDSPLLGPQYAKRVSKGRFRPRGLSPELRKNAMQKEEKFTALIAAEGVPTQGTFTFYSRQEKTVPNQPGRTRNRRGFGKPVALNWSVETKVYVGRALRILALQDATAAPQIENLEVNQTTKPRRSSFFKAERVTVPDRFESSSKADSIDSSRNIDEYSEDIEEVASGEGQTGSKADILPSFERLVSVGSPLLPNLGTHENQPVSIFRQRQKFGTLISQHSQHSHRLQQRRSVQLVAQHNMSEPFNYKKMSLDNNVNLIQTNIMTTFKGETQNQDTIIGKESNRVYINSETEPSLASPHPLIKPALKYQSQDILGLSESNRQINDDEPQIMRDNIAKSHLHSVKNFEVRENLKTLKYYKFPQVKFPMIFLLMSLLVLLISSVAMFTVSKQTLPVVEDIFPVLRSSLSRIYDMGEMNWYLATILFFLLDTARYGFMVPIFQRNLLGSTNRFEAANLQISSHAYLFSSAYKDFIFARSTKLYTEDFSNHNSTTNYVMLNAMEASNLLADNSIKVVNTVDFSTPEAQSHIDFLTENMYNDLLSRLQEFSSLIIDEISLNLNTAEVSANTIFIIVPILFSITIAVLIGIYTKSFIDTRKFLELFTHFKSHNIENIQFQMNQFKDSLDATLRDPDLLKQLNYRKNLLEDRSVKGERDKVIRSKTLYFPIYKRAFMMLVLLLIPIIVSQVSKDTFTSNLETITPTLIGMIKPKEIVVQGILVMTQIGAYERNQYGTINSMNMSDVLNKNLDNLSWIVSEESLTTTSLEYYDLFHQDYCQFVMPEDYSTCAPLFNRISTSGITGMILTLQGFLRGYKVAIETRTTNYILAGQMADAFSMLKMANEAIDTVQTESFDRLDDHLDSVENTIVTFIIIGIALCLVLSSLGTIYVYYPSVKERQEICKVLLMFPSSVILQNSRLKTFMRRDSSEFQKLFQMMHQ